MLEAIRSLSPTVILYGSLIFVVLVLAVAGYIFFAIRYGPRARFKRRLESVAGKRAVRAASDRASGDSSRRKEMQVKLKETEEGQRTKKRRRNLIRQDIQQAGLNISVRQYAISSVVLGFVAMGAILALRLHPVTAILVGVTLGLGVPKFLLSYMRKRRIKAFTMLFANAIDVIVRGIQSGLPVGECLGIISRESPEPVGSEFKQIVDGLQIGLTLEEALKRTIERVPSQDLKFFAIVLQIQAQTGGNLAETLNNLTKVLRDRKKMKDKVSAMAAEANTSAAIIGSLPFVVTGLLTLVNPGYISMLFTDTTGNILLIIGLVWMAIGTFIMRQMISFEI